MAAPRRRKSTSSTRPNGRSGDRDARTEAEEAAATFVDGRLSKGRQAVADFFGLVVREQVVDRQDGLFHACQPNRALCHMPGTVERGATPKVRGHEAFHGDDDAR